MELQYVLLVIVVWGRYRSVVLYIHARIHPSFAAVCVEDKRRCMMSGQKKDKHARTQGTPISPQHE